MRLNQIVQWTLLPAGLTEDGQFAASVFIAPRLRPETGATLADFPDFADWPATLSSATVTLQREDGNVESPMQTGVHADGELWRALFPPDTPVRPFVFDDYADRPIISYPFLGVLDHLKERWASLAVQAIDDLPLSSRNASPIGPAIDMEMPPGPVLGDHFGFLRRVFHTGLFEGVRTAEELSDRMRERLRDTAAVAADLRRMHSLSPRPLIRPFEVSGSPSQDFYSLSMFHRRPLREPATFPADQDEAAAEIAAQSEFHGLLSSLGDHPTLMRRLGLVIDLVIRPDFVPEQTDNDAPGRLRVLIDRQSAFPPRSDPAQETWNFEVLPWALARFSTVGGTSFFSAAERSPVRRFAHGFLRLDPAFFAAVAVDVDGLALKALNMAATLNVQEEQLARPVEEPAEAGVPTPRTGGLALVHKGHADELHGDFYTARANDATLEKLDPSNPPVLAAEDLIRGFRMDVFDDRIGIWRSLQERNASYTPGRFPDGRIEVEDEGTLQLSLTGDIDRPGAPADPDGAVYAHEALMTWDGWSLAAGRPELAIEQEPPVPVAGAELGPPRLETTVAVRPGSLPRLRFGEGYRLRVRTVDLAGNAHGLEVANAILAGFEAAGDPDYIVSIPSEPMAYRRFEPVPPPELVARRRFGPGEGLERLVLRSNFDKSAEEYAADSQAASIEMFRYVPFCDRHVAPPKASLQMTEQHGMFDRAFHSVVGLSVEEATAATEEFYNAAARENGSFLDLPGAVSIPFNSSHADDASHSPDTSHPPGYPVIDADQIELPYLPDPLCDGAVVRIELEPGQPMAEHRLRFDFGHEWFQLHPMRLRLAADTSPTAGEPENYLFVVGLPPGRTARLKLNSLFRGDPELFGLLDWCRGKLSPSDADKVAEAINMSRHWMTTPWRTIELIHAVQQPLEAPWMELALEAGPAFHRGRDESVAALAATVVLDIPSTARIDLVADWEDVVDDTSEELGDPANLVRKRRTSVLSFALPEPFGTPWSPEIELVLSRVDDRMVRFATEMPEETIEDFRRRLVEQSATDPTMQERHRLAAAASHIEQLRPHDFGDTRYRRVDYHMIASTRFREYFDPDMPTERGQRLGNVETVEMLSSAVPPVPVVIDVVPLLGWEEGGDLATGRTSTRRGIGLRVWLARPWFETGAGEMLGLVCSDDGGVVPSMAIYRDVTYIARDPLYSGITPQPLGASRFADPAVIVENVDVTANEFEALTLVAFHPTYDKDQDAWYCDLRFDTGPAYFPFVRLGLVRYQPNAIPGCALSRVTPTYFIQPLPDRSLTVTAPAGGALSVRLHGPAPMGRMGPNGVPAAGTNVVVAVIERQDPLITDSDIGWMATGEEVVLDAEIGTDGIAKWSGEVPVLDGATGPLRLCVREYEQHLADDRGAGASRQIEASRLVHADYVLLDL